MKINDLSYNATGARYGYNGKEQDNEVKGNNNSLDFGARIYDPRVSRFLSQDPLMAKFAYQSPYIYAGDSPINSIDKNGEYKLTVNYNEFENGKFTILKIVKDDSPKYNSLMLGQIQLFKDIPFADVFPLIPNTVEYVKWDGNGNKISSSGELPLKNIGSTRYPGPFNPKDLSQNNPDFRFPPINSLDLAGMEHDRSYSGKDAHGASGAFFRRDKEIIEADIKLVSASLEVINMFLTGQIDPVSHQPVDFEQARAATGVAILFTGLAAQKMLINTHLQAGKDILKQIEVLKQKIESLPSNLKSAAQGPLNQMSNELTPNP